jgi:hypothetical protein
VIAHADHALMILTRTTLAPIFAPRIAAFVTRAVIAGPLIAGAVVARPVVPGPIFMGPIFTGTVIPRAVFSATVVTAAILTALTAALGAGLSRLGCDTDLDHRLDRDRLQGCHFSMRLHRAIALVSVAATAARSARFITRAVGPV